MYQSLSEIKKLEKSDLHNHSTRGGNIRDFVPNPIKIKPEPAYFNDLDEMQVWFNNHIRCHLDGREGFEARVRSAFKQAEKDKVARLAMSFGMGDAGHYDNLEAFIKALKKLSQAYKGHFTPELAFVQFQDPEMALRDLKAVMPYDYFKAIDLFGDDRLPLDHFKAVYDHAGKHGLTRKAHVGEFGDAQSVKDAIKILNLEEVQHGIAAVGSQSVKDYIKDRGIRLNICPSSNVYLKRVKSYAQHPIGSLFRAGIKVTINTDDLLIFDQSVSQEYHNLYTHGVLTQDELEAIRQGGLV